MTFAMKSLKQKTILPILLFFLFFTGCDTLNSDSPEVATLSTEDAEVASELIANTLSDESEGLMTDITDLRADIGINGLDYRNRKFWRVPGLRPCRGENRSYDREYDATSGVHTITYARDADTEKCTKAISATLNYQFIDSEGNFIETPRVNRSEINQINFDGVREGSSTSMSRKGERSSTFSQSAAWNLTGVNEQEGTLEGEMSSEGSYTINKGDSLGGEGTYAITLKAVDVIIANDEVGDDGEDIERLVTGTLEYTISVNRIVDGETVIREGEGTIELEGSGKALLRFLGLRKIYKIDLANGEVDDDDNDDDNDDDSSDDD